MPKIKKRFTRNIIYFAQKLIIQLGKELEPHADYTLDLVCKSCGKIHSRIFIETDLNENPFDTQPTDNGRLN